ncbi:hypothetical protein PV350_35365 [Streptomyces sp. PA03-6a]|nr:hypothetical protein [Streptomyces sp. PA03-6a]
MGEFRLAGAFVEARMDRTRLDADIARLRRESLTVDVTANLDDASRRKVERDLDHLTRDRNVRILAGADTRVAADEIRNLTRRQRVRIGVDVDTRVAADDLANLTRRRTARVTADADTAAAEARLDRLARDRTVNVRADMRGLGGLGSLGSSLGSSASSAGLLGSSFARLAAAAFAALPAVAGLGQALVQMGPAAAVAVPALGGLVTIGAALAVGLHGLGDAFKSAFDQGASSATSAASAARSLESAQINASRAARSLKEAQTDAARQIADANKRVTQAERDLTDAQRDARQMQEDLNEARKEAAEQLEDLNNRLADAQLDERQAVMDLADAEKDLNDLKAKGGAANADDLARAQLAYDKAAQRLSEQRTETARLQDATAEANRAGVEGSDTVVAAQQRVADAQRNVGDRALALRDAQQGVADAQVAAARQVRGAQEALADAQRGVAAAMAQGSTEATKFNDAMSKLSPNAQSFVRAVQGIAPAWSAVRVDVQDRLFRGLGDTLTRMSTAVLPSVRDGLGNMADVLNRSGKGLMDTFTKLADQGLLKRMFDGFTKGFKPLEKIPGQFADAFVKLSIAAAPTLEKLTTAFGRFATGISDKLGKAFEDGRLEKAIDTAVDLFGQLIEIGGNVFSVIGSIFKAADTSGGSFLDTLERITGTLANTFASDAVQGGLKSFFSVMATLAKTVAPLLDQALRALGPVLEKLGPPIERVIKVLGKALGPIIDVLGDILVSTAGAVGELLDAVSPLLPVLGDLLVAILQPLAPVMKKVGEVFAKAAPLIADLAATLGVALVPVFEAFGEVIIDFVDKYADQMIAMFPTLMDAFIELVPVVLQLSDSFSQILLALAPLLPDILTLATSLIDDLLPALLPLLPPLVDFTTAFLRFETAIAVKVIGALKDLIGWFKSMKEKMQPAIDAVRDITQWIADKFQWLYDVLIGHSIIPDMVNGIIGWFTGLWESTKKIFTDLKNWVVEKWNSLWNAAREKWNSFWSGLRGAMSDAWKWARDSVSGLKTSVTNTWTNLWNGARDKVTSIFSTIRGKISDFKTWMTNTFATLRDGMGKVWTGIQSKLATPVKWVVGHVYNDGLRKMWNTIAGKISSKITLPSISLGFNTGGVVPGGRGTRDTVPAMLTPGERILSNDEIDRLGGYRAIDAMLGKDRPTGTGGNPTSEQERKRTQATQSFADGGIVGAIKSVGGAIGSGLSWAKDLVVGGLKAAAQKAISSLVRPLIDQIPGGGFGSLLRGLSNKALDGMLGWFGNQDKKAVGGPAVQRALAWARTQNGKPYQWGGNGNPSFDCSGLMSAIESVIRGESPHRRWATGSFRGANAPSGWVRGLASPFEIGITNQGVGHTAGTLAGVNVESRGGDGIIVGPRARGANSSLFTDRYGFKPATVFDRGGMLMPGQLGVNMGRRPEAVLDPAQTAALQQMAANGSGGDEIYNITINLNGGFDLFHSGDRKRFAKEMADDMKEQIRKLENARRR